MPTLEIPATHARRSAQLPATDPTGRVSRGLGLLSFDFVPRPARFIVEPIIALVFLGLWINAELGRTHTTADLAVLVVISAAIALSRFVPHVALAAIMVLLVAQLGSLAPRLESTTWPVYGGILIVAFTIARDARKPVHWVALALSVPIAGAVAYLMAVPTQGMQPGMEDVWTSWTGGGGSFIGPSNRPIASAFVWLALIGVGLYVGAWSIGLALRLNLTQLHALVMLRKTTTELGVAEVELQVAQERDRLARDVHDVLAHSLAVVIAQADGARFFGSNGAQSGADGVATTRKDAALLAISDAARSALIDVRTLVEQLREDAGTEPQPGFADLPELIQRVQLAGLTVLAEDFGQPKAMTPAQELTLYRIVQESLTNALRHAGARSSATLSFDWRGPGLAYSAITSGSSARSTATKRIDDSALAPPEVRSADIALPQLNVHPAFDSTVPSPTPAGPELATSVYRGAESPTGGHGIRGMRDRARLAGGWLTADASENEGGNSSEFIVTAYLPTGTAGE